MILATLLASFLPPPAFSVVIAGLTGAVILHRSVRASKPLPEGALLVVALWFPFAALAIMGPTFNYGHAGQNVDAFKFFFAGLALILGMLLGNDRGGMRVALPIFVAVLTAFYGLYYLSDASVNQDTIVYPPDNNNSAAMLAVFLPIIILRTGSWLRYGLLGLMILFAFLVASRTLLALSVLAFTLTPKGVREQKLLLLIAVPFCLAILFYQGFSLNNFSDQLRLQILQVSYYYAVGRGFHPFNFGEAAFTDFLNVYPIYRRLEIQHAHNVILQIWVAYGWVPLIAFLAWLCHIGRIAWRDRNVLLLAALVLFLGLGMIEAIITDIRSFGVIMFLFGYSYTRGYQERRERAQQAKSTDNEVGA